MALTSFFFLCFFAVVLIVYYAAPVKGRAVALLLASVVYYLFAGSPWLIVYPIAASLVTHFGAQFIYSLKDTFAGKSEFEARVQKTRAATLALCVALLLGNLIVLKYMQFSSLAELTGLPVPVGLSFYTFTLLGFLIDVYNGIAMPFDGPWKTLLSGMFFPLTTSGPILTLREDGAQFFSEKKLDYENLTYGAQRALWGFFQKLVISERLAIVVATVYDDPAAYNGAYIWLATVCFAFRLYTDFAGCMDIALGLSEMLGIRLPENFRTPFFAKSISEYWRRWHITLGAWMRAYVFYPLLRARFLSRLSLRWRERFGRKKGGRYANYVAMFILWLAVGLWHGGALKYVIGSGLLHWCYIVLGETTAPFWKKLFDALHIPTEGKFADAARVVRTFFLVCLGFVFFRADTTAHALTLLKQSVATWNVRALIAGGVFTLGLDWIEWGVTLVSLAALVVVDVLRDRATVAGASTVNATAQAGTDANTQTADAGDASDTQNVAMQTPATHAVRASIARLPLPARWALWMALLFYVILLGKYGPDFSPAEFIYKGF